MVDDVARASALVLAAVFGAAAVAKAARPRTTRESLSALGLPVPAILAIAVPAVEGLLAVVLVLAPKPAARVSLVVLALFTAFLWRAVARGTAAPCACFGSSRSEPVSSTEIVRNALLLALAVVAEGAPSPGWPGLPALVVVTLATAMGRVLLALLDLRRRTGSLWPGVPS